MTETTLIVFHIARIMFAAVNICLIYIFLTPKRPVYVQILAFTSAIIAHITLRQIFSSWGWDPFFIGYLLAILYLPPVFLSFKEKFCAKIFVIFMILSFSQFNFLFFLFIEKFFYQQVVAWFILIGQFAALLAIPYIRQYISQPIKNIVELMNQQSKVFVLLPITSFLLLAFYGIQRKYILSIFIPLVLSTIIVFFAYYLIAFSIEQTKRHKQLEARSRVDNLTGVYNRCYMEQLIQEEYAFYKNKAGELALIIVDVDLFKGINDRYGHAGGDFVLKAIAEELRKAVREDDVVARWGGDEFMLMLPRTDHENALNVAERIRTTIAKKKYQYEQYSFQVTVTLGLYVSNYSGASVEELIKQADILMYQGKRTGRNSVVTAHTMLSN